MNSVGAGDSMVAGFLYGYLVFYDYEKAFHMGIATGSASAFSEGLAQKEEVEESVSHGNCNRKCKRLFRRIGAKRRSGNCLEMCIIV